jgi:hypothetical protein
VDGVEEDKKTSEWGMSAIFKRPQGFERVLWGLRVSGGRV